MRRPLCRPPPLDAPQLLLLLLQLLHASSGGPRHKPSVCHTIAPRKHRATSRYFRGHPHARTPAHPHPSLLIKVRAAQRICSSDPATLGPGSAKDSYYYYCSESLVLLLYLSPAAPQPCPTSAQPFAIVPSLSVLILSPPRPPGILQSCVNASQ